MDPHTVPRGPQMLAKRRNTPASFGWTPVQQPAFDDLSDRGRIPYHFPCVVDLASPRDDACRDPLMHSRWHKATLTTIRMYSGGGLFSASEANIPLCLNKVVEADLLGAINLDVLTLGSGLYEVRDVLIHYRNRTGEWHGPAKVGVDPDTAELGHLGHMGPPQRDDYVAVVFILCGPVLGAASPTMLVPSVPPCEWRAEAPLTRKNLRKIAPMDRLLSIASAAYDHREMLLAYCDFTDFRAPRPRDATSLLHSWYADQGCCCALCSRCDHSIPRYAYFVITDLCKNVAAPRAKSSLWNVHTCQGKCNLRPSEAELIMEITIQVLLAANKMYWDSRSAGEELIKSEARPGKNDSSQPSGSRHRRKRPDTGPKEAAPGGGGGRPSPTRPDITPYARMELLKMMDPVSRAKEISSSCGPLARQANERQPLKIYKAGSCVVCDDATPEVLFPCGHLVLCMLCAGPLGRCPMCRACRKCVKDHEGPCAPV